MKGVVGKLFIRIWSFKCKAETDLLCNLLEVLASVLLRKAAMTKLFYLSPSRSLASLVM